MEKSLMNKLNWILVISGVVITYFGFYLTYFITTNYDGLYAFFSVLTIVSGLILVILGLSLDLSKK
ncbi:MAG: hypothetical protein N2258_02040 [Brevinematales bacterium]|nr:hypothetical protein [Brevinematales bacterium]